VALGELIDKFLTEWALRLEAAGVTVEIQVPDPLPLVKADVNYLWRVFDNLVANALKYNPPPRSRPLTIQIIVSVTAAALVCHVIDNGVGIDPAIAALVFERYQRGNKSNNHLGLGLGLNVCRQIIRAHGGDIQLNPTVEQGTDIWFTLPLPESIS
jgi:two-component system sensor histidine kinase/response regulator